MQERYMTPEWNRKRVNARWHHDPHTFSISTRRNGDVRCPHCGRAFTPILRLRFRWLKNQKLPRHKQGRQMVEWRWSMGYNRPEAAREARVTVHQWRAAEMFGVKTPWVMERLAKAGVFGRKRDERE